jgi:ankyrin repeat protein
MINEQEFKNHIYKGTLTLDICKEWVERGGDINIQNKDWNTALMWASLYGYLDIVKVLVENGAKIDLQNEWGDTALMWASSWDHLKIVQYLIEKGAKLDIKNKWGKTALIRASIRGYLEIVKLLVGKGAKIDLQDINSRTALYYLRKNIQGIKLFLQFKQYSNKIKNLKRKNISFNSFLLKNI